MLPTTSVGSHLGLLVPTHQSFDLLLELLLCRCYRLLGAHDGDDLPVLVLLAGEDDPGPGLVPNCLHVAAVASNQELVMLGLGAHLCGHGGESLLARKLKEHFLGLLNVFFRASDGDLEENTDLLDLSHDDRRKITTRLWVQRFLERLSVLFSLEFLQLGRYKSSFGAGEETEVRD
jgi:hypothetical protein